MTKLIQIQNAVFAVFWFCELMGLGCSYEIRNAGTDKEQKRQEIYFLYYTHVFIWNFWIN